MRKSFILHTDSLEILRELTDEQAGKLFKAIYEHNAGNEVELDAVTKMCFLPFRNQFKRDLEAYNEVCEKNKINGSKGGRPKKSEENPKNPSGFIETQKTQPNPKNLDSDNDSKNDSDSKSKNKKELNIEFDVFWNLYDKKVSKQKVEQKWAKLKDIDRERIIQTLPAFIAGIKDKQYQPNPETYLNNRRWEDEMPAPKPAQDEERHHDYRRYNNYEEYEYTCQTLKITPRFTKEEFYAM